MMPFKLIAIIDFFLYKSLYFVFVVAKSMEVLLAFSLLSNSRRLLSLTQSPDDIHSVHGIRALNAFMLLMSHKSMMLFYNPYINRTAMVEVWYA